MSRVRGLTGRYPRRFCQTKPPGDVPPGPPNNDQDGPGKPLDLKIETPPSATETSTTNQSLTPEAKSHKKKKRPKKQKESNQTQEMASEAKKEPDQINEPIQKNQKNKNKERKSKNQSENAIQEKFNKQRIIENQMISESLELNLNIEEDDPNYIKPRERRQPPRQPAFFQTENDLEGEPQRPTRFQRNQRGQEQRFENKKEHSQRNQWRQEPQDTIENEDNNREFVEFKEIPIERLNLKMIDYSENKTEANVDNHIKSILGEMEKQIEMAERADPLQVLRINLNQKQFSIDQEGEIILPKFEYEAETYLEERIVQRDEQITKMDKDNPEFLKKGSTKWLLDYDDELDEFEEYLEEEVFENEASEDLANDDFKNEDETYVILKESLLPFVEGEIGIPDFDDEEFEGEEENLDNLEVTVTDRLNGIEYISFFEDDMPEKEHEMKRFNDYSEESEEAKIEKSEDSSKTDIVNRFDHDQLLQEHLAVPEAEIDEEYRKKLLMIIESRDINLYNEFPLENHFEEPSENIDQYNRHLRRIDLSIYAQYANERFDEWMGRKQKIWAEVEDTKANNPGKEVMVIMQLKRKMGTQGEFISIVDTIAKQYVEMFVNVFDDNYRVMAQHLIKMEDLRLREPEYQVILKGEEFEIFKFDAEGGRIWRGENMKEKFRPDISGDETIDFEKFTREKRALRHKDIKNWKNMLRPLDLKRSELAEIRQTEYELPEVVEERPNMGMLKMEAMARGGEVSQLETQRAFPNRNAVLDFAKKEPNQETISKLENLGELDGSTLTRTDQTAGFMGKMGVSGEYFKKIYERVFNDNISLEDRLEVRTTVAFLLEKSEEDFDRIKRFFISTLTMALHARGLNSVTRRKARRNLQLHDEAYWFEHFLLKLCQGFYNTKFFPKSKEAVLFEVTQEDVTNLKFFREVLAEAVKCDLPQIEPFDWNAQVDSFEKALQLIDHPKVMSQKSSILTVVRNGLHSVNEYDSLVRSLSREMSPPPQTPDQSASLVDLMNFLAKKFIGINSSNKANDPERALFDFSMDISISQVRKDHLVGDSGSHFPLFNSHAYFSMFLDQPEHPIYNEKNKGTPFERKPVRIQVISALQKAMNLRSRNRAPLEPLNKIIQEFVEKREVSTHLTRTELEEIEEAFEEFAGMCKDPNHLLKQDVILDTLGSEMKSSMRAYQKLYREHEEELVADVKRENQAIMSEFLGVRESEPVPVLGDGFLDLLQNIEGEDMDFNFGAADAESFYSQLNQFFESRLGQSYYSLKGDHFSEKISGFCQDRIKTLEEAEIKLIFKAAKTHLDLELDDSSAFSRISYSLVNHMLATNSSEPWKLQILDELQDSLISGRQYNTAVTLASLLRDLPTLPSSVALEQTFASEIDSLCQSFNSNEANKLISLLKLYGLSLETVLQSNLNTTCLALSRPQSEEQKIELCFDSGHAILLGLSSGKVLSSVSRLIDSQLGTNNDFILADLRGQMDSLLIQVRRFISLHPLFATSANGLTLVEDSSKYEILKSVNFDAKEIRVRESPLLTARGVLLDRLLPANTVLHHFLFSTSQHAFQRDMMYLLDMNRNIQPLADFIEPLSEDYRVQVETWLSVMVDSPSILKEIQTERASMRELAEAVDSVRNKDQGSQLSSSANLSSDCMILLLNWFSQHLLSNIDSSNHQPLKVSDILADLPERQSELVFIKSQFQMQSLISMSCEKTEFADQFAAQCADSSKNSAFLRFKEDQLSEMQKSFFEDHLFRSTHGIYSQLLSLASFKLGDIEFFSESFHDPRLLASNPVLVKKQSFFFLMSLLRVQTDPLTLQSIQNEMSVEIMNCFPSDRNLFEVSLETRVNPGKSLDLFEEKYMKPLYFSVFKEKMAMFMKGFLFGKTQEKGKEKKLTILEETDQIANPYDPLSRDILNEKNNLLEDLRLDSEGNQIENGTDLISGFDPKQYGEDPFRALGELDLRSGSVIGFNSSLSTLRPELVRTKIEALMRHMENVSWKEMYQRDSEKTFQNAIEQNYKLTDQQFWDHFKNYVDQEVFKVAQVRREYRGILEKQVEMNKQNLKQGRTENFFEEAAKAYYQGRPKWDSSPGRDKFDQIVGDQVLYDEITGKKTWRQMPEPEDIGEEAGWFNAARMAGVNVEESMAQVDNSRRIVLEKGEKTEEGLENWKLVEHLSRLSDRDMMEVMWRSAQGEEFPEKLDLSERERELVLEVGQDYFEMLERKERMDLARSTTATVRQARELEMRVFEDVMRLDFITALQNRAPQTPLDIAESRFQEARDFIINNGQSLFREFVKTWNLESANIERSEEGVLWVIAAYNHKLEETEMRRDGDMVEDLTREIQRIRKEGMLFEDEKRKAQKQHETFQMQSDLRRILGIMNQIVCHDNVISQIADLNQGALSNSNGDTSEDSSSSMSSEDDPTVPSKKTNLIFKFRKTKKENKTSKREKSVDLKSLADFQPVKDIMTGLCQEYESELSKTRPPNEKNIHTDFRKSAFDESEDLDLYFQNTENETQMKSSVRLREIELEKSSIKIETFLFYVKSLKRHRKIQILENELEQLEKDMSKELENLEARVASLSAEEEVRYNNLLTLQRLREEGAEGVQLFEFMTGFRDLQVLYKHREWAKSLENYNLDRDQRLKELRRVRAGDVLKSDELMVLQGVGLRSYLAHDIGISAFVGNPSIEQELRNQALEINKKYGEQLIPSELEVSDVILGEVLNLKDEWWDRTPSIALLREDLAERMFPDAQDILHELKNTPEGRTLVNLYKHEDLKKSNESMIEPVRGEDYTAYNEGGEYSTSAIFDQTLIKTNADIFVKKELVNQKNHNKEFQFTPEELEKFENETVSSLKGPQIIGLSKLGVPHFLQQYKRTEPEEWERDLKSAENKPENLMKELKLLNMKVKLIEEDLKDLEKQKEISYLNKIIRLERAVRRIREQGGEPTQRDIQILMKEYGVLHDPEADAFSLFASDNQTVFDFKTTPSFKRFVHAKARLMSDYLLRFDPEFRRDFLKNKTLDKIEDTLNDQDNRGVLGEMKERETKDFKPNLSHLNPDIFGNDSHGILVRASANLLGMDLPQTMFKATNYLSAGTVEKHVLSSVDKFVNGVEEELSQTEGEIFKAKKTRRIKELDYFSKFQDVVGLKGHFSPEEQEAIFSLFNPSFGADEYELPLIRGSWTDNSDMMTKQEFISALKNPTIENRLRLSDFLLRSVQNLNSLDENHEDYLKLVQNVYAARENFLTKRLPELELGEGKEMYQAISDAVKLDENTSQQLNDLAEKISVSNEADALFKNRTKDCQETATNQQIESLSSKISLMDGNEISSAHYESFDSNLLNQKLLEMLENFDLEEVGLDATFKETLRNLDQKRRDLKKFKDTEKKMYNYDTKNLENNLDLAEGRNQELKVAGNEDSPKGYFPKTFQTVSRSDLTTGLAEQVVITNSIQSQLKLETEAMEEKNQIEVVEHVYWGQDHKIHTRRERRAATGVYNMTTIDIPHGVDHEEINSLEADEEKENATDNYENFLINEDQELKEIYYGIKEDEIEMNQEEVIEDDLDKSLNIYTKNLHDKFDEE